MVTPLSPIQKRDDRYRAGEASSTTPIVQVPPVYLFPARTLEKKREGRTRGRIGNSGIGAASRTLIDKTSLLGVLAIRLRT